MSREELSPWVKEQLARFEQLQQNLQAILAQKQQVESELNEIERAVGELKKASSDDVVYKSAGAVLIRVKRDDIIKELEEKKELANTRIMVLSRQESRLREAVKEAQAKLGQVAKGGGNTPENA